MINLKRLAIRQVLESSDITKPILFPFTEEEMKELLFDSGKDNEGNQFYSFNNILYAERSKIDFSNVSFEGVFLRGIDLSKTYGIKFNPQLIYNKDLSGTKLNENIEIIGNERMNQIDLFEGVCIKGTEFNGCKNVIINPQTIAEKEFSDASLKGVRFNGSFDGVKLWKTNFSGSIGAQIDPKTVRHLDYCVSTDAILLDLPAERGGYGAKNYNELLKKRDEYKEAFKELILDQLPPKKEEPKEVIEQPKQKRKWF